MLLLHEIYELSEDIKIMSDKLDEIRRLSKNLIPDYRHAPYNNDWNLVHLLLDEKIEFLRKESE